MIRIDEYAIDIAISESYSFESEVTSFPVEQGSDLTDHIRVTPLVITIECVVSNTPIGRVASDPSRVDADAATTLPGDDAFRRLVAIRDARKPVPYEGRRGRFENMVLSFQVPDDIESSGGTRFTATLKQIQIAENRRVTIKSAVSVPRGRSKIDKGAVAGLNKLGGLKAVLVFTIRPGQKVDPTAWWATDPNKKLVFTSPSGRHYRAEQGARADGYVDPTGYHPLKTAIPTAIDITPVTSDGTPIPQTTDYVSPLEQRIGPKPVTAWQDAWGSSIPAGLFGSSK